MFLMGQRGSPLILTIQGCRLMKLPPFQTLPASGQEGKEFWSTSKQQLNAVSESDRDHIHAHLMDQDQEA